jgi:molecular chaperone DnaJ
VRPVCAAGPSGDLYIFIEVEEHALFQRDGMDLYCRVPVSMTRAALGGEVEVPSIDGGRSRVKVPEGSQSGRQMRLRGKGMPALRGTGMGDMYIELAVETPVKLNAEQKGAAAQVRGKLRQVEQPRRKRLLRQGPQVLGRPGELTTGLPRRRQGPSQMRGAFFVRASG